MQYLTPIKKLNAGQELIDQILKEGSFSIQISDNSVTNQFAACWDNLNRLILIGLASRPTDAEIISSIIFELHNAAMTSQLDKLDELALSRKISKESYVRGVEHVEYMNSIKSARIVRLGVEQGIFPRETHLGVYSNFEEYLYYQKISGHSAVMEHNYELLMRHG